MVKFVKTDIAEFPAPLKSDLEKVIIALSAEAALPAQQAIDRRDAAIIAEGKKLLVGSTMSCVDCHKFHESEGDNTGPDLTGYGSRDWLVAFISDPKSARFFGERNDRMPAFGTSKMRTELEIVADWLRGDWYRPAPGAR